MSFTYDDQNIFAKILRGEIPNTTVYESEHALAFKDINPAAPVHILVIPKGPYVSMDHFCQQADAGEIEGFMRAVGEVCKIADVEGGFRVISNARDHGMQEVPHLHFHILGGRVLGPLLAG